MAQKPLPAVPGYSNARILTTLTTESQSHLSDFIHHILSEADDDCFPCGTREAWGKALELGLVELGNSIQRGDWLAGVQRARKVQKVRRDAEREDAEREKARAKKELEELGKGKLKRPKGSPQNVEESPERGEPEVRGFLTGTKPTRPQNTDTALARRQIQELISRPSLPTPKYTLKHLLLSVTPFTTVDRGAPSIACVFNSGVFSLAESGSNEGDDNVVLYGLDEWDGAPFNPLFATPR
jgi:1-phosphatidylinositol-3-phosphate 5-kinase